MNIYEYSDYKDFVRSWIAELPKAGRGELRRIAVRLGVSTTMVSQVFNGEKHLSLELACELADYLGLNDLETEYFFLLIDYGRAGSYRLQQQFKRRIEVRRQNAKLLTSRLSKDIELSEATKAIFYSSWLFSGVRNLAALENSGVDSIASHLKLPRNQVQKVLDFLIREGLVSQKAGKLTVGARRTLLPADSPLVTKHHQNWRLQAFQKMVFSDSNNLFYTGPMTLSREVAAKIREELPSLIEKINKMVIPSSSEVAHCLNIDWFEF
jgi:uncharacterized protein (TIGR02147 family)